MILSSMGYNLCLGFLLVFRVLIKRELGDSNWMFSSHFVYLYSLQGKCIIV